MPAKTKSLTTTKLMGFAIVTAGIVLGTTSQIPVVDQHANEQLRSARLPVFAVPVDRNLLSQQLLPAPSNFTNSVAPEKTLFENVPQISATQAEQNKTDSQTGPSLYELRLDDQKAWGSQPRRAGLVSTSRQLAESSENVVAASSQSPIVPGIDDPHLWYESQQIKIATDIQEQQEEQFMPDEPLEIRKLPVFLTTKPLSLISRSESNPAKTASAPTARTARAWETGRY